MIFERTFDHELIKLILTHPRAYRMMATDATPSLDCFEVPPGDYNAVLCRTDGGLMAGLFMLEPISAPSWAKVHFCFLPHFWGEKNTVAAGKDFIQWAWENTSLDGLRGETPSFNRLALNVALACGFRDTGEQIPGGSRNGEPFHLVVSQIRRPNVR